jgi:HAD superfamily hydrolase (TIGR01509 family)
MQNGNHVEMSLETYDFAGVLFDMDGTLVDTEPLWNEAERTLMADFNTPWTEEDNKVCIGGPADRVTNYMADKVRDTGQTRPDPTMFMAGFFSFMIEKLTNEPLNVQEGALDLLQEVSDSGLPTALVSTSPRMLMDAVLTNMGQHWFDFTLSGDEVERPKPDPLPYQQASATLGVDPGWCIAIEDSPPGAQAARASGAFVVALTHSADFETTARQRAIPSLAGLSLAQLNDWFVPPDAARVD